MKFTMELESLPVLDVLVPCLPDGHLGRSVFCKSKHTDRYVHANSNHHPSQKLSLVNGLIELNKVSTSL